MLAIEPQQQSVYCLASYNLCSNCYTAVDMQRPQQLIFCIWRLHNQRWQAVMQKAAQPQMKEPWLMVTGAAIWCCLTLTPTIASNRFAAM